MTKALSLLTVRRTLCLLGLIVFFALPGSLVAGDPECANSIDDDGNGFTDLAEPKCSSVIDDDESSFGSGIPGDNTNMPSGLDCFFDGNSGDSDDDCQIHACCMIDGECPKEFLPFDPKNCQLSGQCIDTCGIQTKTDCDCFGCCQLCDFELAGCFEVFIHPAVSPDCDLANLNDPDLCLPCSRNTSCPAPPQIFFDDGFEILSGLLTIQ